VEIFPSNQRPFLPSWTNEIWWWFHPPMMFRMRILVPNGTLKRFPSTNQIRIIIFMLNLEDPSFPYLGYFDGIP
jgi:hypothetical protein